MVCLDRLMMIWQEQKLKSYNETKRVGVDLWHYFHVWSCKGSDNVGEVDLKWWRGVPCQLAIDNICRPVATGYCQMVIRLGRVSYYSMKLWTLLVSHLTQLWVYLFYGLWETQLCSLSCIQLHASYLHCMLMEFLSLCGGGKKPFGDSGDTLAACFLCGSIIWYSCLNLVVALGMCMVSFPDPWYGTGISCTKGLRLRLVLAPSLRAISHSYGFVLQGRILYRWGLAKTGKGQLIEVIVTETKVFGW